MLDFIKKFGGSFLELLLSNKFKTAIGTIVGASQTNDPIMQKVVVILGGILVIAQGLADFGKNAPK